MRRHVRIFAAGVVVVAPFAITAYLAWWAGSALDGLARSVIEAVAPGAKKLLFPGVGALLLVVLVYLVGLLTHVWAFRWAMGILERIFARLPVVKTLYESVRDIMNLFASGSGRMGQVVRYRLPGAGAQLLGIQTSTAPRGAGQSGNVSVFLPMSYQLGGFTIYVPPDAVEPTDLTVEEALKIAATADAGAGPAQGPGRQGASPAPQAQARDDQPATGGPVP